MSMRNTTIQYLAIACTCLLLAACGEDGETTDSIAADNGGSIGNGGVSGANHGQVQFSAPAFEVNEDAGNATVTITRTDGTDGAISVRVASRDSTASAADYTAVATTVTFNDGDAATKSVLVPIINDTGDESDETLYLTLSTPTGGASLGSAREALLTILDDDVSPPEAPKATLSAVYKQLHIDWTAAAGATSYRVLKDPTGSAGYTQVGADLPATQRSADVQVVPHKEDWVNARYSIAACNAAGCTQSAAISPAGNSVPLIGYLKASNAGEFDSLGSAVALSADGNTLAVGARSEDSAATGINGNPVSDCVASANCAYNSGAVYIYTRSGSTWSPPVYVKASNTQAQDSFGSAVSLSADGNLLAVGASGKDTGAGAVYVFTRVGDTWSQTAYRKASDATSSNNFGSSVALSADGTQMVVGAQYRTPASTTLYSAGAAYVYERSGATWTEKAILTQQTPTAYSYFGSSVAIATGQTPTIVVGALGENVATGNPPPNDIVTSAGAAYIYTLAGSNWTQSDHLTSAAPGDYDSYGAAVAIDAAGATIAVGASGEDLAPLDLSGATIVDTGAVYVYAASGLAWIETARLRTSSPSDYSYFGNVLALSADGNTLVATNSDESGSAAGVGGTPDETAPSSGAAYVFARSASTWSAAIYVKASNTEFDDGFGSAVALSADGNTLAVTAQGEDSAATGFNGNQLDNCDPSGTGSNCAEGSGAVYVY